MYHYIFIIILMILISIFLKNSKQISESFQILPQNNKYKIIICMSYTDNISSYSKYTEYINKKYAEKHGYDFIKFNYELKDRAQQWCKVKAINHLLENNTNKYDYIFWIDSDAFFNNFNQTLDSIINKYNNKDIIICDDYPNSGIKNTINTGTMFIKFSEWNKEFCKKWFNYTGEYLTSPYHEQSVLDYYINHVDNFKNHVIVCPTKTFNSAAYELNEYKKTNDFIIHLMARNSEFRINYIKKWIEDNHFIVA